MKLIISKLRKICPEMNLSILHYTKLYVYNCICIANFNSDMKSIYEGDVDYRTNTIIYYIICLT